MRTGMLALVVACSCLPFGAETARADGSDLAYVRKLVTRGYLDLAEAELRLMLREEGLTKEQRFDREMALRRLASTAAFQSFESRSLSWDPSLILPRFDTAIETLRTFRKVQAADPGMTIAEFELGRLLLGKGDLLLAAIEERRDPGKTDAYRRLADKAFDAAFDLHAAIRKRLLAGHDRRHMRARSMMGVAITGKGLAQPEDSLARRTILMRAKSHWEELVWDFDDLMEGAFACMHMGRVHAGLGEDGDTLEYLRTVAGIDVTGESEADRELLRELILTTGYQLGRLANDIKTIDFLRPATATLVEAIEKIPEAHELRLGHLVLIELAGCYLNTRRFSEAIETAKIVRDRAAVIPAPWTRRTGALAERLIRETRAAAKRSGVDISRDEGD
jgi:hypothetical protein